MTLTEFRTKYGIGINEYYAMRRFGATPAVIRTVRPGLPHEITPEAEATWLESMRQTMPLPAPSW